QAKLQRWPTSFAIQGHQARLALNDHVISGAGRFRAAAVVTRYRAIDQPRVLCVQLLKTQAHSFYPAELEVLQYDIAFQCQLARVLLPLFGLQVETDRTLVAVDAIEVRGFGCADAQPPVACVITALRMLDLNYL